MASNSSARYHHKGCARGLSINKTSEDESAPGGNKRVRDEADEAVGGGDWLASKRQRTPEGLHTGDSIKRSRVPTNEAPEKVDTSKPENSTPDIVLVSSQPLGLTADSLEQQNH